MVERERGTELEEQTAQFSKCCPGLATRLFSECCTQDMWKEDVEEETNCDCSLDWLHIVAALAESKISRYT